MRTHICCIFYLPWYVCLWWITKNSQQSWRSQVAFSRKVDCWIFVPDHGRLPPLDCKEGFRISRWPHSCLEKALPAWAEAHELLNPFICHSQRAGWDERKRGPGFLVAFSKPDHHTFIRLHSTQILERKAAWNACCPWSQFIMMARFKCFSDKVLDLNESSIIKVREPVIYVLAEFVR